MDFVFGRKKSSLVSYLQKNEMFFISVFILSFFFNSGITDSDSTTATYENEMLVCGSDEAVNFIDKVAISGPRGKDYKFKIGCTQIQVCDEVSNVLRVLNFCLNNIFVGLRMDRQLHRKGVRQISIRCRNSYVVLPTNARKAVSIPVVNVLYCTMYNSSL